MCAIRNRESVCLIKVNRGNAASKYPSLCCSDLHCFGFCDKNKWTLIDIRSFIHPNSLSYDQCFPSHGTISHKSSWYYHIVFCCGVSAGKYILAEPTTAWKEFFCVHLLWIMLLVHSSYSVASSCLKWNFSNVHTYLKPFVRKRTFFIRLSQSILLQSCYCTTAAATFKYA